MGKVITLAQAAPENALEGLNRLTGLTFDTLPESLLKQNRDTTENATESTGLTVALTPTKSMSGR